MDLNLTEEQSILRDSLSNFLSETYSFEKRRPRLTGEADDAAIWRSLAVDLGILGASFDEAHGGLGGTAVDTMIIMEQLGRNLVLEPFLETVVLAGGVLRRSSAASAGEFIERIIAGDLRATLAFAEPQARYAWRDVATSASKRGAGYVLNGHKAVVVGAPEADLLIVSARTGGERRDRRGISLFAVDKAAKGLELRTYRTIDGKRAAEVYLEDVAVDAGALLTPEGEGYPLLEQVIDEGTAAICAEASGVLRRLLDDTVEYTKQRKQFGVPIGSFQALQHRMVDMLIQVEQATSISLMATLELGGPDRAKAVSAAKAQVGGACRFVGHNAIQLHGGMGITDELAVSHFFKRATVIEAQFGSTDHHLARYERLALPVRQGAAAAVAA